MDSTSGPMNYFDGAIRMNVQDLPSPAGDWFGWSRGYNQQRQQYSGPNGLDWFPDQLPHIIPTSDGSGSMIVIVHANTAIYFDPSGTAYVPRFHRDGVQVSLTDDTSTGLFTYSESHDGKVETWTFGDYSSYNTNFSNVPQGCFNSYTDPGGAITQVIDWYYWNPKHIQRTTVANGITDVYQLSFIYTDEGFVDGVDPSFPPFFIGYIQSVALAIISRRHHL